ncbi:MAG TPA: hypothetical protein VGP46_05985 [Acidimicrobiales bacterium]|nr:hypothetical protein [Acidimicrobiales bacterium]
MTLKNKLFNRLQHHTTKNKGDWWLVDGVGRRYAPPGLAGPLVRTSDLPRR